MLGIASGGIERALTRGPAFGTELPNPNPGPEVSSKSTLESYGAPGMQGACESERECVASPWSEETTAECFAVTTP